MSGPILIVDDDAGMQTTLAAILEDEGYEVVIAADGIDALEKLTTIQPWLMLLDIGLPRMDGIALAAEMERRGLRAGIPIIVLTADGSVQQKAAKVGADGYVAKPFTLAQLLEQIDRVLASPND